MSAFKACRSPYRPFKYLATCFSTPFSDLRGPCPPFVFLHVLQRSLEFESCIGCLFCAFWRPFRTSQSPKFYLKGLYRPNPLNCVAGVKTLSWFAYLLSQPMLPQFVLTPRAFLVAVGQFRKACGFAKEDSQSHFALRTARGALSKAMLLFPGP